MWGVLGLDLKELQHTSTCETAASQNPVFTMFSINSGTLQGCSVCLIETWAVTTLNTSFHCLVASERMSYMVVRCLTKVKR